MAMPPQLARGLWAKRQLRRKEQRPLVEQLPRIDIADLCRWQVFPNDWHKAPDLSHSSSKFRTSDTISRSSARLVHRIFGFPLLRRTILRARSSSGRGSSRRATASRISRRGLGSRKRVAMSLAKPSAPSFVYQCSMPHILRVGTKSGISVGKSPPPPRPLERHNLGARRASDDCADTFGCLAQRVVEQVSVSVRSHRL